MSSKEEIKREIDAAVSKESELYADNAHADCGVVPFDPDHKTIRNAFNRNQYGDADLAIQMMKGRYCFDNTQQRSFYFCKTHWKKDTNRNYLREMERVSYFYESQQLYYRKMYDEAAGENDKEKMKRYEKAHDAYATRVKQLRGIERVNSVWNLAISGPDSLGITGTEWNRNPLLFPCANCVIDLETGKSFPGRPEQYFNRASSVEYHGIHAEAPAWFDFLDKVFCGNQELIDYFGYFVGLAATGLQTKDFFCAYGPEANNAKSVLFSLLETVLGDFAGTLPVEVLLEEKFARNPDAPSHTRLKLFGLRLATTSEAQANQYFSLAKIKQFTSGGDAIEARGIQAKDSVEFEQTQTLVLHTNFLPKAKGVDNGFYNPPEGPSFPGEVHSSP